MFFCRRTQLQRELARERMTDDQRQEYLQVRSPGCNIATCSGEVLDDRECYRTGPELEFGQKLTITPMSISYSADP